MQYPPLQASATQAEKTGIVDMQGGSLEPVNFNIAGPVAGDNALGGILSGFGTVKAAGGDFPAFDLQNATQANQQLSRLPGFLVGDVADVARQGFEACMNGDTNCVPGVVNRAAMLASRSTPKWLLRRVGGLLARRAG